MAHAAGACPSFCNRRQLPVLLLYAGRDAGLSEGYSKQYVSAGRDAGLSEGYPKQYVSAGRDAGLSEGYSKQYVSAGRDAGLSEGYSKLGEERQCGVILDFLDNVKTMLICK